MPYPPEPHATQRAPFDHLSLLQVSFRSPAPSSRRPGSLVLERIGRSNTEKAALLEQSDSGRSPSGASALPNPRSSYRRISTPRPLSPQRRQRLPLSASLSIRRVPDCS